MCLGLFTTCAQIQVLFDSARSNASRQHAVYFAQKWTRAMPASAIHLKADIKDHQSMSAHICAVISHVRFAPKSGHVQCITRCLLRAKSRHLRCEKVCRLTPKADMCGALARRKLAYAVSSNASGLLLRCSNSLRRLASRAGIDRSGAYCSQRHCPIAS